MIVYGTRTKQLLNETTVEKCPHCGKINTVELLVVQKYFHIFWIPTIAFSKAAYSHCSHCKQSLKEKEMAEPLKLAAQNLKSQAKTPIYLFSGVILFAIAAVGIAYSIGQDKKKYAQYISAPKAGDIFEIKAGDSQYTLYKADQIKGDTVFILQSNYETSKLSGLRKIDRSGADAWSEETTPVLQSELKTMFDKGEILSVER